MQGRNFILEFEDDECGSGKGGVRIRHDDELKNVAFQRKIKHLLWVGGISCKNLNKRTSHCLFLKPYVHKTK